MVCNFVWGKNVSCCISSSLTTEIRSLPLLSLVTDASMVRERCSLVEGKSTQQIEQQIEKRIDNCIPGTIIIRWLDTPSWQEIPDVVHQRRYGRLGTRLGWAQKLQYGHWKSLSIICWEKFRSCLGIVILASFTALVVFKATLMLLFVVHVCCVWKEEPQEFL